MMMHGSIRAAAWTAVLVVMLPWSAAGHALSSSPSVELSPQAVVPGEALTIAATGFPPGDVIDIFVDRSHVVALLADAEGIGRVEIETDPSLSVGIAWITARSRQTGRARQVRLRLVPGTGASLPTTGADAGRTGWNPHEAWITPETVGALEETWRLELSVLDPGESVPTGGWDNPFGQGIVPCAYEDGTLYAVWWAAYLAEDGAWRERGVVYAIDPATGHALWSWLYEGGLHEGGLMPAAAVMEGTVIVAGGDLVGLDTMTGEPRWSVPRPSGGAWWIRTHGDRPVPVGDTVYVTDGATRTDAIYAIDAATGNVRWSRPAPWADLLLADRDSLYVRTLGGGGRSKLMALDSSSGATRWTHPGGGVPLLTQDLLITDTSTPSKGGVIIEAIDAGDGATRWTFDPWPTFEQSLPGHMQGGQINAIAATDRVVVLHQRVEVCRGSMDELEPWLEPCPVQHRLIALSLEDGSPIWERDQRAGWRGTIAGGILYPAGGASGLDITDGSRVWDGIAGGTDPDVLVADGRLFVGTVHQGVAFLRAFGVSEQTRRPEVAALVLDPTVLAPASLPSSVPATTEGVNGSSVLLVVGGLASASVVAIVARVIASRRHRGRQGPDVTASSAT